MRVPDYQPDLDEPRTPKQSAMSLHNLPTTLTPAEHHALSNAVTHLLKERKRKQSEAFSKGERLHTADQNLLDDCITASLWLAAQDEKFYQEWAELPAGSHLKEAYSEQVWNWSDRDMAVISETDPLPEGLRFPKPES
ncbi:hypothetical protein [Synechococcus sp. MIT S9503]|uniref:hypothetical protein n=1 Tax=Synechococcus sp. MIT S9503 TaxID=3082547 RepID=UPI0039A67502